jgi:hypothetical protein
MAIDTLETVTPATGVRTRRALLTAALGGLGGLFAARLGAPDTAAAAAGGPFVLGAANSAGTANSSLTTASAGTALLVTQNGTGTALRGSAVGAGSIAGFFTAFNGTGISGVTASPNTYGIFGSNDGAAGTGAAIRASGKNNNGLVASTDNGAKAAVMATNTGAGGGAAIQAVGGNNNGVSGSSGSGIGVYGSSDSYTGVYGESTDDVGVYGTSGSYIGVYGTSTDNIGVAGYSSSDVGVYGYSPTGWAGYFDASLYAVSLDAGSASAAVKAFRIDHPADPAGKVLMHSCVESNERLTVYAGTVTTDTRGEATTIELPNYFEALNRDLRYQLTVIGSFAQAMVKRKVGANRFTIATSEPGTEVCWQVTGVRRDAYAKAHPLVVESAKVGKEKGKYLHPVEHGQPESKGVHYELRQRARRQPAA